MIIRHAGLSVIVLHMVEHMLVIEPSRAKVGHQVGALVIGPRLGRTSDTSVLMGYSLTLQGIEPQTFSGAHCYPGAITTRPLHLSKVL